MKLDIKNIQNQKFHITVVEPLTVDDFIITEKLTFREEYVKRPLAIVEYTLTFKPEIVKLIDKLGCNFFHPYSNTPRIAFYETIEETISKSKDTTKYIKNKESAMKNAVYRSISEKDKLIKHQIDSLNKNLENKFECINRDYTEKVIRFYTGGIGSDIMNIKNINKFIEVDTINADLKTLEDQIKVLKDKRKEIEIIKHAVLNEGMLNYCKQTKMDIPETVKDEIFKILEDRKGFSPWDPNNSHRHF